MSLHDIWRGDVMSLSGEVVAIGRNSFDPSAPVVPCFDVHARELDLHDHTGSTSGIVTYDGQREHLISNPSTSGAVPVCTAFFLDAYNSSGDNITNLFSPAGTTIEIDTIRSKLADAFHVDAGEIHVWTSGTYHIAGKATTRNSSGRRFAIRVWLEHKSANGSFVEVPGSRGYIYTQSMASEATTVLCTVILETAPGDVFRLVAAETSTGAWVPVGPGYSASGCSLTLEKMK